MKQMVNIRLKGVNGKFDYGRYKFENREWLESHHNAIVKAQRINMNYYQIENGMQVHIYEAFEVAA